MVDEPKTVEIPIAVPTPESYRELAVHLVLGPAWSYEELAAYDMPSWKQTVDAIALALVNERRAGILLSSSGVAE